MHHFSGRTETATKNKLDSVYYEIYYFCRKETSNSIKLGLNATVSISFIHSFIHMRLLKLDRILLCELSHNMLKISTIG